MATVDVHWEGLDAFKGALDAVKAHAEVACRAGANEAAKLVASRTARKLATTTHKKGTPTPSAPGQPPSLVTGTLRRSVKIVPAVPVGSGTWQSSVGPTAVYARVQELGGQTGRHGATRLPARPYLEPALREVITSGELWAAFRSGWGLT